jgi:hypothetical protein
MWGKGSLSGIIFILERLDLKFSQPIIMGFADLSIAEIAAEYDLPIEEVYHLCDQLGIAYKTQETRLALEDAKAIISEILSKQQG